MQGPQGSEMVPSIRQRKCCNSTGKENPGPVQWYKLCRLNREFMKEAGSTKSPQQLACSSPAPDSCWRWQAGAGWRRPWDSERAPSTALVKTQRVGMSENSLLPWFGGFRPPGQEVEGTGDNLGHIPDQGHLSFSTHSRESFFQQ